MMLIGMGKPSRSRMFMGATKVPTSVFRIIFRLLVFTSIWESL